MNKNLSKTWIFIKFVHSNRTINNNIVIVMEDLMLQLINDIINNFDVTFCITVNIATYITIKTITDYKKKRRISTWNKRIIFLIIGLIISTVYCITGSSIRIIFNSFILAPVSWSWVLKPICDKLNIGYSSKIK